MNKCDRPFFFVFLSDHVLVLCRYYCHRAGGGGGGGGANDDDDDDHDDAVQAKSWRCGATTVTRGGDGNQR
jgi:hypothetical protein